MINSFKRLSIQGSSMGELRFIGPDKVGKNGDIKVAKFNVGNKFETVQITPQLGFDFNQKFNEQMKVINASIVAGEVRTNSRSAKVATYTGKILPLNSNEQDAVPVAEFDSVFVTGKNKRVVGRVRSLDAFDSNDLLLYGIEPNYKTSSGFGNDVERDENGEPIISNWQYNFIPKSKAGNITEDDYIRILVDPTEHERIKDDLKQGQQVYPQGLSFAFVGNATTDWTVYASQIDFTPNNPTATTTTPKADNKPADEAKGNNDTKKN
jgi:hypothetical protein